MSDEPVHEPGGGLFDAGPPRTVRPEPDGRLYPITSAPAGRRKRQPPQRGTRQFAANLAASLADVRTMLREVDDAMRAEQVAAETRRRVANRLLWDDPEERQRDL